MPAGKCCVKKKQLVVSKRLWLLNKMETSLKGLAPDQIDTKIASWEHENWINWKF